MKIYKAIVTVLLVLLLACAVAAQRKASATTGGVKGKVRGESGATVAGVAVSARRGEREVAHATTGGKGEFLL
ncbi:MAG TPA: hypothetical protein VF507_08415, partial [Pyrinomonadaceae bacterium]